MALKLAQPDSPENVLKRFMQEFFPFADFRKSGIFTKEMRGDYKAQSEKICNFLGLKSIYEYRKDDLVCHVSYSNPKHKPEGEGFLTVIPNIWD